MHYGASDYSKTKGLLTMESKTNPIMEESLGSIQRGARDPLSHRDKAALNKLFQCQDKCPNRIGCAHNGYVDRSCKCACPYGFSGQLCEELEMKEHFTCESCSLYGFSYF